jgi:hypothetical protein
VPAVIVLLLALVACRFEPGSLQPGDARVDRDGPLGDGGGTSDGSLDAAPMTADARTSFLLEAEDADSFASADGIHTWSTQTTLAGFTGTGYIVAGPNGAAACGSTNLFCGALATYSFDVAVAGSYRFTFRHHSTSACCDSVFWTIGVLQTTEDFEPDAVAAWTDDTSPQSLLLLAGTNTMILRMREQGAAIDSIRIELQ